MWSSVLLLLLTASAAKTNDFYGDFYEGDQVIRVLPDTESKVEDTKKIYKEPGLEKLDSWLPTFRPNHPADIYAKKKELPIIKEFLTNRSISYSILVKNVTEALLKQRTMKRRQRYHKGVYDYQKFHPLDEIHEEINKLHSTYPNVTEVFSLGQSYEKREMKAIKISSVDTAKRNRRIFFIECGTHAREWLSPATCMWLIKAILKDRVSEDKHKRRERLCHKIDWVIVPVLNVDGYVHSWSKTGRFWRKNRRPNNNSECIGTDLNRNWGYKWGGAGASKDPCTLSYCGTSAFSEIETRNVAKYLYKHRCQLLGYIGLHSYSQLWMTPWGYKKDKPEHYDEMVRVAKVAVNAIKMSRGGAIYEQPGPSSEMIYPSVGSSKDWIYGVLNVQYSYGIELRPHYNGKYGFLIPPDQIKPAGQEIAAAIKGMSTAVHLYEGRRLLNLRKSRNRNHHHHND